MVNSYWGTIVRESICATRRTWTVTQWTVIQMMTVMRIHTNNNQEGESLWQHGRTNPIDNDAVITAQ